MKKLTLMLVLIGMFAGGCGETYYWHRDGATLQQVQTACRQCYLEEKSEIIAANYIERQEAQQTKMPYIPEAEHEFETFSESIGQNKHSAFRSQSGGIRFYNCMKAKGYRRMSDDFLDPSLRKRTYSPTFESSFSVAGK